MGINLVAGAEQRIAVTTTGACAYPPLPVLSPLRTNKVTLCLPIAAIDEIVGRSAIPTSLARVRLLFATR
ncbi:hypothetical protein RR46_14980 [Papilio xuthus]|uniref:Uncharacterized protein n=1 Tax=Papilio xuthus TaxID=66420 RepID=A0A194PDQ0_PAPXU|nr:hypothetical protein RR46_14980 [Papilio xuthus]